MALWRHYRNASGTPVQLDLAVLLGDPGFLGDVEAERTILLQIAADSCQASTCIYNADSLWHGTEFTAEDNAYAIGGAQFRLNGTVTVHAGNGLNDIVSANLTLSLYKDWNFDDGKVAHPSSHHIPLPPGGIDVGQFGNMPQYGDARTYYVFGSTQLMMPAMPIVKSNCYNILV